MQRPTASIVRNRYSPLFLILAVVGCSPPESTGQSQESSRSVIQSAPQSAPQSGAGQSVPDESPATQESAAEPPTAHRFRLADDRPSLDESRLNREGIQVYRSKRLILLSDCPAAQVEALPGLVDELFESLESRLGILLPASNGDEFQLTGCVMDAEERFRIAGLLPEFEFAIRHGRHLNYRFWMRNVTSDYYRRHLLFHEVTHCFLMCENGVTDIPPLWYTEGIAEYFATHTAGSSASAAAQFGVLPNSIDLFPGWGRISEIRRSFDERPIIPPTPGVPGEPLPPEDWDARFTPLSDVLRPNTSLFVADLQYAQAWALYWLLEHHPACRKLRPEFHPVRTSTDFQSAFEKIHPDLRKQLAVDWLLFQDSLIEGFEAEHSFSERPERAGGVPTDVSSSVIAAKSGWQFSGMTAAEGCRLAIGSAGRFTIAADPQPWISEPQGVTIQYHRGRPLGELLAMLVAPDGSHASRRIAVGTATEMIVPFESEIWLQLNDSAARRSDNQGDVEVTLKISR